MQARNDLENRLRLKMRHALLITGTTERDVARWLKRRPHWVRDRLHGKRRLTLDNVSDIALACGLELRFEARG